MVFSAWYKTLNDKIISQPFTVYDAMILEKNSKEISCSFTLDACGYEWAKKDGQCYWFNTENYYNFLDAQFMCFKEDADLVTVKSHEETMWLYYDLAQYVMALTFSIGIHSN